MSNESPSLTTTTTFTTLGSRNVLNDTFLHRDCAVDDGLLAGDALNDTIIGVALTDASTTPSTSLSVPVVDGLSSPNASMLRVDNRLFVATCEEADSNPTYNNIIAENINYMLPPDNNATPIDSLIELHTPSNVLLCFVAQFYMVYLSPFLKKNHRHFITTEK
jgi:hypothetical protein